MKKKNKTELWYDGVLDLIVTADKVREEDLTIAVESSIFAMEIHQRQEESTHFRDYENDFGSSHSRLDLDYLRHRESRALVNESQLQSSQGSFSLQRFFGWRRSDDASDASSVLSADAEDGDVNGLFGCENQNNGPLSRFFSNKMNSDKLKNFIALSAWALSLAGLAASLTFLTRDFIRSTQETTSVVHYEWSPVLDLPKIWFCIGDTNQPFSFDVPDGYEGQPLFWMDFIMGTRTDIDVRYPDTERLTQLSFTSIETNGKQCDATKVMDVEQYSKENYVRPRCFHCMAVRRNPAFKVERRQRKNRNNLVDFSSRVVLRFSRQSFISSCRTTVVGMALNEHSFFRNIIKTYSKVLAEKGILDFGGLDPLEGSNSGLLFPQFRLGGWNTSLDFYVYDVIDMYCNVYIFSGYFYPTKEGTDIRFQFNPNTYRWKRSGQGPYFPSDFSLFDEYVQRTQYANGGSESKMIGSEQFDNRSLLLGELLYIITDATVFGEAKTLHVIDTNHVASISFSRTEYREQEMYEAKTMSTRLLRGYSKSINHIYLIELKFTGFFTRIVTKQQAMAWTAFLADFFGLTSLFLDISIYTILISPISGRKAPGQQKSRKRASEKANRRMKAGYTRRSQ